LSHDYYDLFARADHDALMLALCSDLGVKPTSERLAILAGFTYIAFTQYYRESDVKKRSANSGSASTQPERKAA
jgi:hypothetical protein